MRLRIFVIAFFKFSSLRIIYVNAIKKKNRWSSLLRKIQCKELENCLNLFLVFWCMALWGITCFHLICRNFVIVLRTFGLWFFFLRSYENLRKLILTFFRGNRTQVLRVWNVMFYEAPVVYAQSPMDPL